MNNAAKAILERSVNSVNGSDIAVFNVNGLGKSEHFVQFYEKDAFLAKAVAGFLSVGLSEGENAIIIATENHRQAIAQHLHEAAIDVDSLEEAGRVFLLDAGEALKRFMVNGSPDEELFQEFIGELIKRATAFGTPLRAFGEMVALLWAEGNSSAAIRLEELWNNLAKKYTFSLFCAYPMRGFAGQANGVPFAHICKEHSRVFPAENLALETDADQRGRTIALLQQRADSLEAEVAERKDAERKLVETQDELREFLENAVDGIHRVSPDGIILWANRSELQLLGYSADEYIGHHIAEFHADKDVIADILARLSRGDGLCGYEARMKCKDGSIRHVSISSRVYRKNDRFVHTQCVTRDITERKLAAQLLEKKVEERTAQLQQVIGELEAFSYSISHDMRSPLRAMQGYARSLLDDYRNLLDTEGVERLERIERASTRLDQLVRDVLSYTKISQGKIDLKPVKLNPLIEDILHQDPVFQENRQNISFDGACHSVVGHEAYLSQCLANLIGNALKFVAPGTTPSVRIRSERVENKVRVVISDNGVGIRPEQHDRIFKMFGRVYSDEEYPGTGIGLAIAKKAILRMGGEIGFDSPPSNSPAEHGTDFWFILPEISQ